MFTKSDFGVAYDSTKHILNQLATLYDAGVIQASVTHTDPFDLKHLITATKAIEAGHSVGKTSLFMKA